MFYNRINRGWSLEEALEIPININSGKRPYFYNYYGKDMTLEQISKITKIKKELIYKRIRNGWNIYEAAEIPKQNKVRDKIGKN